MELGTMVMYVFGFAMAVLVVVLAIKATPKAIFLGIGFFFFIVAFVFGFVRPDMIGWAIGIFVLGLVFLLFSQGIKFSSDQNIHIDADGTRDENTHTEVEIAVPQPEQVVQLRFSSPEEVQAHLRSQKARQPKLLEKQGS